ncbi:MAG: glycosyltransferase [Nanoarchaeota archaeon]
MIFVTIGTHPDQFDRLIRRIDKIAPKIKEEIIVQRGFTKYTPKNIEYFDFTDKIDEYYKKSRIVIAQSATSLIEFILKYGKPVITVPREAKYKEHINDHQVEFAEYFAKKANVLMIRNMKELTPKLLINYRKKPKIDLDGLYNLQDKIRKVIDSL